MKLRDLFPTKLRNLKEMQTVNNGQRPLLHSILIPEVEKALSDWLRNDNIDGTLIGGLAYSYWCKPRSTQDFDVLFLSDQSIPQQVQHFRAHRKGAFEHKRTGVEAEVISPQTINLPQHIAHAVFTTAVVSNGMHIASPSGIVALKLARFNIQDQADIVNLAQHYNIDLTPFGVPAPWLDKYNTLMSSQQLQK